MPNHHARCAIPDLAAFGQAAGFGSQGELFSVFQRHGLTITRPTFTQAFSCNRLVKRSTAAAISATARILVEAEQLTIANDDDGQADVLPVYHFISRLIGLAQAAAYCRKDDLYETIASAVGFPAAAIGEMAKGRAVPRLVAEAVANVGRQMVAGCRITIENLDHSDPWILPLSPSKGAFEILPRKIFR